MAATTAIDPLELMRESIMAGVPLVVNGSGVYTFGQHSFPETTKTKFRRTAKSK